MGGCCGGEKRFNPNDYAFNIEEVAKIKNVFTQMSSSEAGTAGGKSVGKTGLKGRLPENQNFAGKLYKWAKSIGDDKNITFETFLCILEAFIKDDPQSFLGQQISRGFDRFELFLQISLEKSFSSKDNLPRTQISFSQATEFLTEIFNIFHADGTSNEAKVNRVTIAKLVATSIYKTEQTTLPWSQFASQIREYLPHINDLIPIYMAHKFVDSLIPLKIPNLDAPSQMLNRDLLGLFYLHNHYFQQYPNLHLLYSSQKQGRKFQALATALKEYHGPTLILMELASPNVQKRLIGAFSKVEWKDEAKYFGNTENYVFNLMPTFKCFKPATNGGNAHYLYMNTKARQDSRFKVGIGFGGKDFTGCKLWIDSNLDESYVDESDSTYEKGSLGDGESGKINIINIEAWGLMTRGTGTSKTQLTDEGEGARVDSEESQIFMATLKSNHEIDSHEINR